MSNYTEFHKIINSTNEEIKELLEQVEELKKKRVEDLFSSNKKLTRKEKIEIDNKIEILEAKIQDKRETVNAGHAVILEDIFKK